MNRPDEINEKKQELTTKILKYLLANPNAQDTRRHIVKWWLFDQYQTKLVTEVLDKLEADGLVIAQQVSPSETLYKMNPLRRDEIQAMVNKDDSAP